MTFKSDYQSELAFLRALAHDFAQDDPWLAQFLDNESGDESIERLFEGFAFLTTQLRRKLDDDLPETTHPLLQVLWPNYLRPVPSLTLVRFEPIAKAISERQPIAKGTRLFSSQVEGVSCEFRTCTQVAIHPLQLTAVTTEHRPDSSILRIELQSLTELALKHSGCDNFSVQLIGEPIAAQTLYLWLSQHLRRISIVINDKILSLPPNIIDFPGFTPEEALLPSPRAELDGYRLLQEYFHFPQRFWAFRLNELAAYLPDYPTEQVSFQFTFHKPLPAGCDLRLEDLALYCTPAINQFQHTVDATPLDGQDSSMLLQPPGVNQTPGEVFCVDRVSACRYENDQGQTKKQWLYDLQPFESLDHPAALAEEEARPYYQEVVELIPSKDQSQRILRLLQRDGKAWRGNREVLSIEMTCTHGQLPSQLGIGEIDRPSQSTPAFANFSNITRPTQSLPPLLDGQLHWQLLSNLSLNSLSLNCAEGLRAVLASYDFAGLTDLPKQRATRARLQAIEQADTRPLDWLFKGVPVRGLNTTLRVDPSPFDSDGELYLFGSVLSYFFTLYASPQSFHKLDIINTRSNEHYSWPARVGRQVTL